MKFQVCIKQELKENVMCYQRSYVCSSAAEQQSLDF